ncbi:hypothetical protein NMD1_04125 [Novosphingobium sp. MD-1]|nr:hypothetical protein NMD1_04125 [Novosphingobium sp. MD-1]
MTAPSRYGKARDRLVPGGLILAARVTIKHKFPACGFPPPARSRTFHGQA